MQKLLNERRMNRSERESQHSNYQHSEGEEQNQFGGYNPESLYQEEVIQEYSMNDNNSRVANAECEDSKYREAVEYARSQIERERAKRMELQQIRH